MISFSECSVPGVYLHLDLGNISECLGPLVTVGYQESLTHRTAGELQSPDHICGLCFYCSIFPEQILNFLVAGR